MNTTDADETPERSEPETMVPCACCKGSGMVAFSKRCVAGGGGRSAETEPES